MRSSDHASSLYGVRDVKDVLVLICGHGGRDARCGEFGPVLKHEFESVLARQDLDVEREAVFVPGPSEDGQESIDQNELSKIPGTAARVGLISHIGGHKFAGNVIIYIPPGMKTRDGEAHPLAGCGIWYGRVEPRHVEGIVKETVIEGNVIEELFRGGIRQGGEVLRI